MTGKTRLSRPEPERTRPIRLVAEHLGRDTSPPPETETRRQGGRRGRRESIKDVASEAVGVGYHVIEEQIERGRRAAERIRDGSYSSGDAEADLNNLVGQVVRVSKDLGVVWFKLLSAVIREPRFVSALERAGLAETRARIEIHSKRRAQVTLEMDSRSVSFVPFVPPLTSAAATAPPLTGIKFQLDSNNQPVLVVDIPDNQPPGIYDAVVVDKDTHERGGTIRVQIYP